MIISLKYLFETIEISAEESFASDVLSFKTIPAKGKEIEDYASLAGQWYAKRFILEMISNLTVYAEGKNLKKLDNVLVQNQWFSGVQLFHNTTTRKWFKKIECQNIAFKKDIGSDTLAYAWFNGIYSKNARDAFNSQLEEIFGEAQIYSHPTTWYWENITIVID